MATYGEGEPTDNAASFYKWIRGESEPAESNCLAGLDYCVFGLGNRQYEHFNRMGTCWYNSLLYLTAVILGKITNELVETLGARRVATYGEGDDDGSLEEDFERWKDALWPELLV